MSKKSCFLIFVAVVVLLTASFMLHFAPVTTQATSIFSAMTNPYIAVSAVILSLLLQKQRSYGLLMLACAIVTAVVVHLFLGGGAVAFWPILYKTVAFLVYVYLLILIRFMI